MLELIFLTLFLGALFFSAWSEDWPWAVVGLVAYGAATWLFGDPTAFAWLLDPVTLLSLGVVFLFVGTLWSLWKWRRHVKSERIQKSIRAARKNFDPSTTTGTFIDSNQFPSDAMPSYYKRQITTWIILWPFSMAVYFFEDFLMDIVNWIYERLVAVYRRITLSAIPDDLK